MIFIILILCWQIATDAAKRPDSNQAQQNPISLLANDVIVIDSSDTEDELDAMITDDMKLHKSKINNNSIAGEILVSVRTEPSKN